MDPRNYQYLLSIAADPDCPPILREAVLTFLDRLDGAQCGDGFVGLVAVVELSGRGIIKACDRLITAINRLTELLIKQSRPVNSKSSSASEKHEIRNVIRLPVAALILTVIVVIGVAFTMGHMTAHGGPRTDYHTDDGGSDSTTIGLNGITWDLDAISQATSSVVWITNFPNVDSILKALCRVQSRGVGVVIIIGADSTLESSKEALLLKLAVYKSPIRLENPQSLLFIDRTTLVDGSRQQSAWRTSEPSISREIDDWMNRTILPNNLPLHLESDHANPH